MTIAQQVQKIAQAAPLLAGASAEKKNAFLEAAALALLEGTDDILAENTADLEAARAAGMSPSMQDRLRLTPERVAAMARSAREIAALPDPVGRVLADYRNAAGLRIRKVSVPFGVVGIIFEARPNVSVDAGLLCFKSGNGVLLRGGREAYRSNAALIGILRRVLKEQGFPEDLIRLVDDTSRESASAMMAAESGLDLLIPRGGKSLIERVVREARVPVIATGVGNCHIYVDKAADPEMAVAIVHNAKVSRPSVCNAAETLLIHREIAPALLPRIAEDLWRAGVQLRGDERARAICPEMIPATEEDFATEYNNLILSVGVVDDLEAALSHIARYSTRHSECIVTQNEEAAVRFLAAVDAAAVYHNASTRFTDGGEFGLGAEIGISTQKLHARGPMGLNELNTYKYLVEGTGQVR